MGKRKLFVLLFLFTIGMCLFAQSGTIRELSGTVELKHANSSNFVAAKIGDRVNQDTVVSTGFRSTALVEIGSAAITVLPMTRLTLTEIQASSGVESLNVNLQAGRVRVDVNPPAGTRASMTVSAPSATASVRGTSFSFDGKNVSVGEGTVSLQGNRGLGVPVGAGFVSAVSRDGKASDSVYTAASSSSAIIGGGDTSLVPGSPSGSDSASAAEAAGTITERGVVIDFEIKY